MDPNSRNHSAKAAVRRKRLRAMASVSEQIFWEFVRKDRLGYRFRQQVSVGDYFLDFYCSAAQLAIELDGEQHEESTEYDARRDTYLGACGIEVIRVPTQELYDPTGKTIAQRLEAIRIRCQERITEFDKLRELKRRRG
jgi:very-short-patch-repair endonuclease